MPTYEYECAGCGHRFERFQNMSDKPLRECPRCGGPVHRLISAGAGVIVKGGGGAAGTSSCSLETTGRTCCGRTERCDAPPCRR